MLRVTGLVAGYHGGRVLHGVDLVVPAGTVCAVVGRNGAGKSTLVHAVAGLLRPYAGRVELGGRDLTGRPPWRVTRAGMGLVPQGRRVFPSLTVAEHLALAAGTRRPRDRTVPPDRTVPGERAISRTWTVPRVLDLLPRLADRLRHRGDQLSGGEQQMLAIARALLTEPTVLLLDEPCEGLAVDLAARVSAVVAELAAAGLSVLLVEQQLRRAVDVADRVAVLDYGRLVPHPDADAIRLDPTWIEDRHRPSLSQEVGNRGS